jgi:DNA mismatch endonuclease Vsr
MRFTVPTYHLFKTSSALSSIVMKRNKNKNTCAELMLRRHIWKLGLRYRVHDKRLPGKPDIVFSSAKVIVFCDGDFWHGLNEYAADMDRQKKLERCGWRFIRIRESQYYANPAAALDSLWIALDRMGIRPFNADEQNGSQQEDNGEGLSDAEEFDLDEEAFYQENVTEEHADTDLQEEPLIFFSDKDGEIPQTIHEALRVKPDILGKTIIEILHERPNETCVRDYMATYILKHWKIRTRGTPYGQFSRKVADVIANMARHGHITLYKSKNWRIKMGWEPYR